MSEVAIITTSAGEMTLEFWPDVAPGHVENFKKLAKQGFYDGTRFHRVIDNFVAQGGDPLSKDAKNPRVGTGGPGYTIKCETKGNPHKHEAGSLSMAHAGKDTGGSQFFLCFVPAIGLGASATTVGRSGGTVNESRSLVTVP